MQFYGCFSFYFLTLLFVLSLPFLPSLRSLSYIVISVSLEFLSNSKGDAPFHSTVFDHSRTGWVGLNDHLRDVLWEITLNWVLLLLPLNFLSGSRLEMMFIFLIVNIDQASFIYIFFSCWNLFWELVLIRSIAKTVC